MPSVLDLGRVTHMFKGLSTKSNFHLVQVTAITRLPFGRLLGHFNNFFFSKLSLLFTVYEVIVVVGALV